MTSTTQDHANGNGQAIHVSASHLEELRKSGLSDEQIARCRFRSTSSPLTIQNLLNWKSFNSDANALVIPFLDAEGKENGYSRLKLFPPRVSQSTGKPIKYESPKGKPNRLYVPPGTRALLADPTKPIIITEGEKKAAKADQEGFACIGLVGVYGWQKKRKKSEDGKSEGQRELIDDMASIQWAGRTVYICLDSDAADNEDVQWAEYHLAKALGDKGANVRIIRLPAGPNGEKVGLDDYLVAHGPDAFRELLKTATAPERPELDPEKLKPNEADDDPHRLARGIVAKYQHDDGQTRVYWPGPARTLG